MKPNNPIPPQPAQRFLRWFLRHDLAEEVQGDLEEQFYAKLDKVSAFRAKLNYWYQVFHYLRPFAIRNLKSAYFNHYAMFQNNIKFAFRIFKREISFTIINILGLTLGIWCSILITLWLQDEFSYDAFHTKQDQLYRVLRNQKLEGGLIATEMNTAYPIGDALVEDFPEISERVRYVKSYPWVLNLNGDLVEKQVAASDPNFFNIFSFPLKEGNSETCLEDLNSIVISEELVQNFFHGRSALGEVISINLVSTSIDFLITGVFYKIPENSSIQFDAILPIDNYLQFHTYPDSWGNSWLTTYLVLDKSANVQEVNNKIEELPKERKGVQSFTLFLQPFSDQYLYSKFVNGQVAGGRIDDVILFSLIAVLTLIIACFNFINLTTARSWKRSREIGIRKVMGAQKSILIFQFIQESALLVFFSIIFAVLLTKFSLPFFNDITSKNISIDYLSPNFYMLLLGITFISLFFSGIYPALFLSSFHAIRALKGKLNKNSSQVVVRKSLVTFQFSLAIILIAGTMAVFKQLIYIQNKDLGLDKENVIYMPMNFETGPKYSTIKSMLANYAGIQTVSASNGNFLDPMGSTSDPKWNSGQSSGRGTIWFSVLDIDYGLLEMLNIPVLQGRSFSPAFSTDTTNFIINEEAAKVIGMDDPIGEDLEFWGVKGSIIGMVKNFHFTSLHEPIMPLIIRCQPSSTELLFIKTQPGKTKDAIAYSEKVHNKFSQLPFDYNFLDETLKNGYKNSITTQKLAGFFSILAIIISCLGLLGLASYTVEQRTKEIAIRKVLGAKIFSLIHILFKEYFRLIVISLIIGIPIAYYWINSWLDNFAYRVELSWWFYGIPGILVFLIAAVTISRLSLKIVLANPSDSLRNE